MKYTIAITSHEYGFVEVEADSTEKAKEKALEAEANGDVHWAGREVEVFLKYKTEIANSYLGLTK